MNKHLFLLLLFQITMFWAYGQCGGNPQATFTAAINATPIGVTACNGQSISYSFTASPSTGSQYVYSWNFGQPSSGANNTATGISATHNFGSNSNSFNAGTYTVTLIVIDTVGIDSCDMATFVVNTGPVSGTFPLSFTATPSATSCNGQPNQYSFTPSVTGNQYIYSWIFGQSGATNTSTQANPTHTFGSNSNSFNPSTYNVTLYVIDTVGNDTCKMVTQNVSSNPIMGSAANFTWTPNSPCSGTTVVNFTGSPASNNQNKYIYSWNFAGLGTASIKNPTFTFPFNASPQTYTVSFMAIDTTGRDTCRFIQHNITVNPATLIEVDTTNFNICQPGLDPFTQNDTTMTFYVTSPTSGTFSWTVTDLLNNTTATFPNSPDSLTYSFPHFGSYTISVFLQGSPCPGFSKTFKFYTNPIASMSLQTNPFICEGDTVRVVNNSIPGTSDYFVWDWGDGTSTTVQDTARQKHVYTLTANACAGTQMTITLYAYNACFLPHSNSSPITIKPKPRPEFSYPAVWCVNVPATFINQTCPNNNIGGAMAYTWSWGDGSATITGSYANQTHTYTTVGTFTITLIATKANGCSSGITTHDIVINQPPVLNVTAAPDTGCRPFIVNFVNNSSPVNNTYNWTVSPTTGFSFTGGTSATSEDPQITFNTVGTYIVTMTASNNCGTTTWKDTFFVKDKPIISYTNIPDQCLSPNATTMTLSPSANINANGGTIPANGISWSFQGATPNTSSTASAGIITFTAGTYPISISATNECGTSIRRDTFVVRAFPNAAANFAFSNVNYCVSATNPLVVNVTGISTPIGLTYSWTAPGATPTPSLLQNPTFTYTGTSYTGVNVITLYATNVCGTDTMQKPIQIKKIPTNTLAAIPNNCLIAPNLTVNITPSATYTLGNSSNASYSWTFTTGVPSTSTLPNPTNIAFAAGIHTIQNIVTNECGSDTASRSFTVTDFPQALASFTLSDTNYCTSSTQPLTISFTGQALPVGATYNWLAPSATPSTSTAANPVFTYPASVNYTNNNTITLTVSAPNGCGTNQQVFSFRVKKVPTVTLNNITDKCLTASTTAVNVTPSASYTLGNSANPVYAWTFSACTPATAASAIAPTISCPLGGHNVTISVSNECGIATATDTFTVNAFPDANATLSFNPANNCAVPGTPLVVTVNNLSTPSSGITPIWSAGAGGTFVSPTTSSSMNPVMSYATSGTPTISLTYSNICGTDTWSQNITVKTLPSINLNSINAPCLTANSPTISLTPSAIFSANNGTFGASAFSWNFGTTAGINPTSSTLQNPGSVTFPAGNNHYWVSATNECGTTTKNDSILVGDFPNANASFTINNVDTCTSSATPFTVNFTSLSTPLGSISHTWSVTPNTGVIINNSTSVNPTISFAQSGTYTVTLTVGNGCGSHQWTQIFHVKARPAISLANIQDLCLSSGTNTQSITPAPSYNANGSPITSYNWTFQTALNNPLTNIANPTNVIFGAGSNLITVVAQNVCGKDTASDGFTITEFPHANASFTINNIDTCTSSATPFTVNFTNLSTPAVGVSYSWSVSPNTGVSISNATAANPTIVFAQSGIYAVTLTTSNICGSHQWTQVFRVKARPDIALANIADICLPAGATSQSITPSPSYNANGSPITSYNWTFQTALNNPATNISNPTNVVFGQGNNVITLIAQNVCGKDTASRNFTITAFPHASAAATVNDANICTYSATPFQVTLNSNSTPSAVNCNISATPASAIVSGNVVTFPSMGLSNITLTCSNICGVDDTTFSYNVHALPTVDVPFIPDGCGFVQFNPSATITYGNTNSSAASYNWQFQNGTPFSSTSLNPGTVTFSPIVCAVSLTVTNVCGSVNDVSNFNIVPPATLVGSNDTTICSNVAPITIHCGPAGGQWNNVVSNVNTVGNQSFATFTPSIAGTYYAIYTYGAGNCLRVDTVKIKVNAAPNVDAGLPFGICADAAPVTLSGTPIGGCFTGSGMMNCTQFSPITVSPSATPYNITYTYTDANQCTSSDQVQIMVNPLPVVNAGLDTTFCFTSTPQILVGNAPANGIWSNNIGISNAATGEFIPSLAGVGNHILLYTFTDGNGCVNKDSIVAHVILKDSIDAGADQSICLNGGILTLTGYYPLSNAVWTGAGVSGNTFNPLVTGVNTVTLTYTTGAGSCQTTDTKNVTIFPVPAVNAGQIVSTCVSDSVVNLTNGTPLGGYWTGFTVNNNQFFPNTAGVGTYPITYHFADGNGCIDSNTTNIVVNPLPQVQFSVPLVSCKGSVVSFNNQSTGATQYAWHFGDGATSFAQNPTHVYADTGHFEVTLIGTSGSSCVDSTKFTLQIIDVPSPSFLMTPDTACSSILANGTGVMASFVDNSLNWGGTYNWNFGNIQNSTQQNPLPVFFPEGLNDTSYVITLDIGNMCGAATFKDTLHILSQPKAIFGTNVNSGCSPAPFLMANISQGGPTAWSWIFGNGNTSTAQNPSVQYYLIGASNLDTTYTITLIASNMCGADTATHQVTVHPNTVNAFFNANPIAGCAPLTVNVTNYSNGNTVSYNMGPAVANPTIVFPNAGTYVIKQYANNGCSYDTAAVTITVNAAPTVNFSSQSIICQGDTANFMNNTQNAVSYSWNFGDNTTLGDTSNVVNPLYVYPTAGNHIVTLTAYANTTLCKASASQTVNVKPAPTIDFSLSDTIGCAAFVVNVLNNTSTGAFHFWDFGAAFPNTSNMANPTFACQTQGTYPIHYTNTDGFGCHADTTFSVVAVEKPLAAFTPSALSACGAPATFNFSNQSTGTNIAYSWNFGNAVGTQTNLSTPSVTYTSTGIFNVTLIVGNNFGCTDTQQIPITVYPQPNANFSISPPQGCAPLTVSFTNTTTNATTYSWDFGMAAFPVNVQNPAPKTYAVPNNYTITLYTTYQNQCFDTATVMLPVLPKPVADFNFTTSGNICGGPYTLTFNNLSQNATTYSWNFHNGVANPPTSTLPNPTYTFNSAGTYIISLTALNGTGCVNTFKDTIVIHPQPNANVLVQPTVGCAPLISTFVNLSTNYTTTSWYYGDNTTPSPFVGNTSPSHTYAIPDTYYLQVIANYQNVCFDTLTVPITVVPLPIANFTYSPTSVVCGAPAPFTFVNNSQMGQNYFWTFGNGVQTAAFDTSIVYQTTGIFPVTLVANNYLGCSNSFTQNITVNPQPNASFSVSPTQGCAPLTVNVTNTTTNATNYSWDWGNATLPNSTLQNPSAQIYPTVGNGTPPSYTITLYANYQNQCFDTTSVTIPVVPQPISDFNFTTSGTHCGGPYTLTFNNLSQHSTHYSWNFGNNVTDTLANPTYTYNSAGIYIISLTAYNDYGCAHTSFDTVTVYPQPQASLLVQPTTGCVPFTTTFVNLSTNYTTTSWYYGDNSAPFVGNISPSHTYPVPDTYYVQIVVNQQNMCFDTTIVPIIAIPLPVANFTYAPTSVVCGVPAPFTFTNLSQFAQNYYWDFGNGITTTAFDTTIIYTAADTFAVTLISSNALGCKDTMMQNIIVNPQPQANITASPSNGCAPLTVNFTNNSTYATYTHWHYQDGSATQNTNGTIGISHIFTQVDTFNVEVIVEYEGICFDTAIVPVIVQPQPLASFSSSESGTHCGGPLTINLQSTTLYATSYLWYLGNGNTATTQNTSVTYTTPDTFTVTLVATNAVGCKDTISKNFILHPQPQALANATPTVACVPATLTVQNLSTIATAWTWNFGDGTAEETAFIPMPHTYYVPANDTLTLIANYQNVCFDTLRVPLAYGDRPSSIFAFSVSGDLCGGPAQIVTDNQSTLATSYLWDFGDGVNYSNQYNDSVIYSTAGDYVISLIATNMYCADTSAQTYHLYDQVTANFIADTLAGCNPQTIAFSSTSINATDFVWYFGDSTSSIQNPVLHTYQDSGTYTVTLIASIGGVCPDTMTKTGFIHINQSPIAAFEMQPEQTGSFDNVIHFINTTQFANQYYWELGDGTTSTMETPEPHAYLTNDSVYATLIAINEYGCTDTLVKHVSMKPVYGLQIPNAFAPYSGVAKANVFMPIGYGLKEYEIAVYSTWGDLVWSSTAIDAEGRPTETWDGKDRNGNPMNSDVFVWEVHKAIFIGNVEWEGMKYGRKNEKAHRRGTLTIVK